jgi:CxxC-x17-CxxC domain-containing protein
MSANDFNGSSKNGGRPPAGNELNDRSITCIDCSEAFVWTVGEQMFFLDKDLRNPPKRCKTCKREKNRRLEAIENGHLTGRRERFEVQAKCAKCEETTTVPFYPSQGRPVYCRACFIEMKAAAPTAAGSIA